MRARLTGQGVWLWLLGAGVLFTVVAVMAIFVPLALVPNKGLTVNQRVTAENNLRTTLVQFAGGSILLFGTALTLYINREGQITERFTRAIDQLGQTGEEKLDIRLGGVYALERIARESSRDRGPIVEVLTAFLRQHSRGSITTPDSPPVTAPRTDLDAVAKVLGRNRWSKTHPYDLANVELRRLRLMDAHFEDASLTDAHLGGAILRGAHFKGAQLVGAHLEWASLDGAHMEISSLDRAHLDCAILIGAHLKGAYLNGTHLRRAILTGAHLEGAQLVGAHLEGAHLNGAHLEGANLSGAHLEGVNLSGAHLEGVQGLTPAQVERVVGLSDAIGVPPGLLGP